MTPAWHPLSAVFLRDPRVLATAGVLGMMLRSERSVPLVYTGDAMWPAVRDGDEIVAERREEDTPLRRGDVVVVVSGGLVDVVRVVRTGKGEVEAVGDACPGRPERMRADLVLARARAVAGSPSRLRRGFRRFVLDLREALRERVDAAADAASTVRSKYDAQAPFYARAGGDDIDPALLRRLRARVPAGGRVVVAGSGAGKECFALEREGWVVTGIDFAPRMVAAARESAARSGSAATFVETDLRAHRELAGSVAAVLFTYDVYSFLPDAADRVRLLASMRSWLAPGGALFLSARRVQSLYGRSILTAQRLVRGKPWGASHTRWIASDGSTRRSFVQVFTETRLRNEIESAGFRASEPGEGHVVLEPAQR